MERKLIFCNWTRAVYYKYIREMGGKSTLLRAKIVAQQLAAHRLAQ